MTQVQKRDRRGLADVFDWLEEGFPPLSAFPALGARAGIRIEDREEEGRYVLRAELPGIDPSKDVEIMVADGTLTIHAERHEESHEGTRSEFRYGSLSRRVVLPPGAQEEGVTAKYTNGILEVTVPTDKAKAEPRRIQVASGDNA
jgi:HSP20 family protein